MICDTCSYSQEGVCSNELIKKHTKPQDPFLIEYFSCLGVTITVEDCDHYKG